MDSGKTMFVLYGSEKMILSKFYDEPVLWILETRQTKMPHIQFVGGPPSEWCIFLKDLNNEELKKITDTSGKPIYETAILLMMETKVQ